MNGKNFTLQALAKCAKNGYGLHSWDDGEFLSFEASDLTRNTVHVHFYTKDLDLDDDKVTITGHAIWVKSKSGAIRQPFTLTATLHDEHWSGELEMDEVETTIEDKKTAQSEANSSANSKAQLFDEVVRHLSDILANTLNETY